MPFNYGSVFLYSLDVYRIFQKARIESVETIDKLHRKKESSVQYFINLCAVANVVER